MAKLFFYFGAMNASKSAQLLMTSHNYKESGKSTLIFKPELDTRDKAVVSSRALGERVEAIEVPRGKEIMKFTTKLAKPNVVLVDEAQFLTDYQVYELSDIVDELNIPVLCFGLRTDFQGMLFEGSKALMEVADTIIQIPTMCSNSDCGKLGHMNMRKIDGVPVFDGEQVQVGGNESYTVLCRKHFKQEMELFAHE